MDHPGTTHRIHWINGLLIALIVVGSALAWPELPERVPGHFGAGGEVTRWDSPSFLSWFGPAILGLVLAGMLYGLARLLPDRPHLFNFPDKDRFLALPPAFRAPVIRRMLDSLYGLATMMLALFALIQWTRFRTAHGADSAPYVAVVLILSVVTTPILLAVWLPRIQREVDRQVERERQLRRSDGEDPPRTTRDAP